MTRFALLAATSLMMLTACDGSTTITITPSQVPAYPEQGAQSSQPVAAARVPDSAYRNPGDPERLLDKTTELLTLSVETREDITDLQQIIRRDKPTRAELSCDESSKICQQIFQLLSAQSIPTDSSAASTNKVTLVYDRMTARDCNSRFVDNTRNGDNLNHPALGCSVVANTIQMIGDKRQLSNPSLMDLPDASKAVQQHRRYSQPPKPNDSKDNSLLKTISTSQ